MTPKATVIVVKATGNVLGVVTHEGDPERGLSAAEVAGDAFPVRWRATGDVLVDVPLAELDATAVPVVDDLLKSPQLCVVKDGVAALGASSGTPDVVITKTKITVTADTAADEREVRVFVEHGQGSDRQRAVYAAKIPATEKDVVIGATFDPDDYDLLAAVEGNQLLPKTTALP
jgi:hypothetical protein